MPATLKSLTSVLKELPIPIAEDPAAITVQYRPHAMTQEIEEAMMVHAETGRDLAATIELFIPVVAEWDFRMDEGEPVIEITKEGLRIVPVDILTLILRKCAEDQQPDPKATGRR